MYLLLQFSHYTNLIFKLMIITNNRGATEKMFAKKVMLHTLVPLRNIIIMCTEKYSIYRFYNISQQKQNYVIA